MKKILIILPHPDDETYFAAGYIQQMQKAGNIIRIIILTRGEAGKNHIKRKTEDMLSDIRSLEFQTAMEKVNLTNYEILDFPDGKICETENEEKVRKYIQFEIDSFSPDIVQTYDNTGITGHPDHICLSKIIFDMYRSNLEYSFELLWITAGAYEKKRYQHLENYKHSTESNMEILLTLTNTIQKIRMFNSYKSQFPLKKRLGIIAKLLIYRREYFIKINRENIDKNIYKFEYVPFEI